MTDAGTTISATPSRQQAHLNLWLLMALGALLCGAALNCYRIAQEYGFMRTNCIVAAIAAGVGIAFAFGGAMHYADVLLAVDAARRPHRVVRVLLVTQKRLMLILQLLGAALVFAAIGAVLFDRPIPGPDYGMLYPGGYTPPSSPVPPQ